MTKITPHSEDLLSKEEVESLLDEAEKCLRTATQKEKPGDYEETIEIRAAKTMFTHYYGPLLLGLVGSSLHKNEAA
jgi:uncharacterized protein (UPF0332 family)